MLNELARTLRNLENAEQIASRAEARYEQNPESEQLEKRFDRAYKNEFKYYMQCVELVRKISGGKIDFETAKKLVQTKRGELIEIIKKTA